ncbi:MerR family transcriptional regulator [Planococcus ruber]|uniref:MerR family transcriptional regulator n=1 Tax=Planococcus ruber TaxID=2027871 RepID=UPI001FF010D5|nr:MerR family transcriptional regulator [Planococcus ruber]MCJ1907656.1 MerR family transcriptional regulator [Planococcus ruber]
METEEDTVYLSTGELAKRLAVSIRTIRYYDQIGLVEPAKKEAGGKRYYSDAEIMDLEKILLLKSLDLSLEDSRKILAEQSLSAVLTAHKGLLAEEMERLQLSLNHTQTLLNVLDLEGKLHWEDLIELVAKSDRGKDWNRYFSEEQQSLLKESLPKLESPEMSTKKWINLIKRIELCLTNGVSPQSLEAQLIVEDMDILSAEAFGNDLQLAADFWEIRKSAEASEQLGLYPIDPAIIEFLEKAAEH